MTLAEAISYLESKSVEYEMTLRPAASEDLIKQVEETYNITLPEDIKQFYRLYNGFDTFDWMFNLIPMKDMIEQKIKYNEERVPLAEYMIYSETWHLDINVDQPNKYGITIQGHNREVTLTHSLAEFIERFVNGGLMGEDGLCHWVEQL